MIKEPGFTIGIEEEYMVVDRKTRNLIREAPETLIEECRERLGDLVTPEFLQCQIEVGTPVCASIAEAREHLVFLRRNVSEVVEAHGLALMAASTHPFAREGRQQHTPKERYDALAKDLQQVVRRLAISGMHVHVGIEDDDLRIDLMAQVSYILPHLLALSTSSPFWSGHDTGLKSYRISIWDELPRTGLPESFESFPEYRRHVDVLCKAGIIEDATKIWWDIRPSERFSTLEMRISDVCTRLDDALCVASLYRCWLRMLYRLRRNNMKWRRYARMLIEENRWRAHRYGIDEGLIDFGRGETVPYPELFEEMLDLIDDDIEFFNCRAEVEHGRNIITRGTSAHQQLNCYRDAINAGASVREALAAVVDLVVVESLSGITEISLEGVEA
ncbi:MAG: putative glutamate--cysteine ligase 2 [marine bacterium B5-7]|nr:MAG: putative glutamate--cysteine ligase 2 [marine bacterium B5-7]